MKKIFEKYPILPIILWGVFLVILAIVFFNDWGGNKSTTDPERYSFGNKCQCYCSDKCGPRDMKHGIDRPFVDKETGLCFCLPRDKANYIPNRCTPKTFSNSCCG